MSTLYPVLTDSATRLITGDPQSALNLKANLASPTFTGVPLSTTAAGGTNTTQIATTAFVSAAVSLAVTGLLELKGSLDCSTNPNYPSGSVGDAYLVTVAGKIGGSAGLDVDIGDTIICQTDNAGGTQAAVGASWFILEHNLAGALLSANNLSDVASNATARTNLGLGTLATQSGTFSGTSSGTNTGDVTLAGENYLSISAQAITAAAVNLSGTQVTGTLADARFPATLPALSGVNLTALNATNLASGTLPAARMPALTGDVTNTVGAVATTIANSAVSLAKMADVATASVFYRNTAGTGAPEVNTLATLKTDLGLTGTNSGDQTISLTGDVTGSGTGSFATTLATVATAGTTGGSTAIPVVTINAKGLTTGITTAAVIAPAGTLSGATLASNVLASSLTSVGTLAAVAITGGAINGATVGATTPATGAFTSLSSTIGANLATSSGNVGIGTVSPGTKLDTTGTIRTTGITAGNATAGSGAEIAYGGDSVGYFITYNRSGSGATLSSHFGGDGATGIRVDTLGNVGIGATIPGARLQVSSGAAGTIGEIIKGAASQTANLTEWQNSSATVLACVTAAGNVGIGTSSPNANAILDVTSTTKAFMPPRMTTTQKNAIASPTSGMVVYDSTLNKLSLYGASAWQTVTSV